MRCARAAAALLLAQAACWQPPRAPDGSVAIPGALWTTPRKPWRFAHYTSTVAPDGATALVVLGGNAVARMDLATGAVVASRTVPELEIRSLHRLADGRWLVTGNAHGGFAGATLDPATLEPTMIPLRGHPTAASIRHAAGQLADGRVVLSGNGIAFAAYDPHTWKPLTTIAPPTPGAILVEPEAVVVEHDGFLTRYSMVAAPPVELGAFVRGVVQADAHGVFALRSWGGGLGGQIRRADKTTIDIKAPVVAIGLASDGARAAVLSPGRLRVLRVADGSELGSFELGEGANEGWTSIAFDGERVIVAIGTQLRVIDLATRQVTPDPGGPYGLPHDVTVADDGRLVEFAARAWRFDATGAMTAGVDVFPNHSLPPPIGEMARVAELITTAPSAVHVRDVASGDVERVIQQGQLEDAWIGTHTSGGASAVVAQVSSITGAPNALYDSVHGELTEALYYTEQTVVSDVDPDADLALLSSGGDMHVVALREAKAGDALPMPACESYDTAMLERHGRRVVAMSDDDAYVWDRLSGDLVASLHQAQTRGATAAAFVPHHDELLLQHGSQLVLWSIRDQQLRTLELGSDLTFGVSPDGMRLGIALADGRTSLVDLDVVRASVVPTAASEAKEPASCTDVDPIAPAPPVEAPPMPDEGPYGP